MEQDPRRLYLTYGPMVYRRCLSILRNGEEAFDAMQDVFVKFLCAPAGREVRYPSTFLYRCATNHSLNLLKRRSRLRTEPAELAATSGDPVDGMEEREMLEHIFGPEPASTRLIAHLRYVDDMDWKEIAEVTGLSVSGLRKRMSRLRQRAAGLKEEP